MPTISIRETKELVAVNNIFCVGANYADHNKEMGRTDNAQPVLFIKPNSAVITEGEAIVLPEWSEDVHHEVELVLLIGKAGKAIAEENAFDYIRAFAVGIDLTARDVQARAKVAGKPWEVSKGFDGSAALSEFVEHNKSINLDDVELSLLVNDETKQSGNTGNMSLNVSELISYISRYFSLQAGDLIFTGTPSGVGPLKSDDVITIKLDETVEAKFSVL